MALYVVKRDGSKQPYDEQKVINAILRNGCSQDIVDKVLLGLRPILKNGVTTGQIYSRVAQLLSKYDKTYAYRYRLREALGQLIADDRYEFEKFIQNLFAEEGYNAVWQPGKAQGLCVDHEIDVHILDEDVYIECKHHRNDNRMTGMGDVLETWARLQDLKDGYKKGVKGSIKVKDFWLVTNTKFSQHAKRYASCKGMTLVGWASDGRSIEKMIANTRCYPITILPITEKEHDAFSRLNIVSTKSFENLYRIKDKTLARLLPRKRIDELYQISIKL